MARLGATASIPCKSSAAIKLTHCGSQSLRQTPLQWEIVALVKASNVVAIEALVTDLHPGAQRAHAPRSSTAYRISKFAKYVPTALGALPSRQSFRKPKFQKRKATLALISAVIWAKTMWVRVPACVDHCGFINREFVSDLERLFVSGRGRN